ncbi:MAG TPA: YcgN family cysteine cluster protein [Methylocystis sp.]|nr:YcgN family cysteine cluster protein [Methylocystis sp.]
MTQNRGASAPFWTKPLGELSRAEWEKLCDGCGRCCLVKLEDEDTGVIHHTSVACKMLDSRTCRCSHYAARKTHVPDCVRLTLARLQKIRWLPPSCAYRLRYEGKDLPPWHPLLTGDSSSVHRAGVSVRGRVEAKEDEVDEDDLPSFIRLWPKRWPKSAR